MNPALAQALLSVASGLGNEALSILFLAAKDLQAGKSIPDTLTDLAETAAEDMIGLEHRALKAAGL